MIDLSSLESIPDFFLKECAPVTPPFPNWEKSFISGPQSILFKIEHRIENQVPALLQYPRLFSKIEFGSKTEGPPGHVHGGASAAVMDELMGILVWHFQFRCVTQELNLQYRKALPLGTAYSVTQINHVAEKIEVVCGIFNEKKTPSVSAQGVFHQLSEAQLKHFQQKI